MNTQGNIDFVAWSVQGCWVMKSEQAGFRDVTLNPINWPEKRFVLNAPVIPQFAHCQCWPVFSLVTFDQVAESQWWPSRSNSVSARPPWRPGRCSALAKKPPYYAVVIAWVTKLQCRQDELHMERQICRQHDFYGLPKKINRISISKTKQTTKKAGKGKLAASFCSRRSEKSIHLLSQAITSAGWSQFEKWSAPPSGWTLNLNYRHYRSGFLAKQRLCWFGICCNGCSLVVFCYHWSLLHSLDHEFTWIHHRQAHDAYGFWWNHHTSVPLFAANCYFYIMAHEPNRVAHTGGSVECRRPWHWACLGPWHFSVYVPLSPIFATPRFVSSHFLCIVFLPFFRQRFFLCSFRRNPGKLKSSAQWEKKTKQSAMMIWCG